MIFRFLGHVVRRGWILLLLGWGALLLGTWLAAPPWDQVAEDREFAFLPADAPSRRAEQMYARAFPYDRLTSSIVLVLSRTGPGRGGRAGDLQFIQDVLEPGLRRIAEAEGGLAGQPAPSDEPLFGDEPRPAGPPSKRSIIARIRTPNAPGGGRLLLSPDGRALLVVVELTTEFLAKENWPTITRVEGLVERLRQQGKVPPGLDVAVTGSAVLGRDHTLAQFQSIRATGLLTVLLVVGLLVPMYRAPLLALIPLATVYLAVQVALNLLAILAEAGHLMLFQDIQIFVTILAYGAGVDYCLFLTARYKEELERGAGPAEAIDRAVGGVGAALAASAATVICGIGMMVFARFGKFHEAGLAIPISLFLVLAATLTFSPSLLRLAGRWAFWPRRIGAGGDRPAPAGPEPRGGFFGAGELERIWDRVGHLLLRRAGTVWLATIAVMAPFVVVAGLCYSRVSYDVIADMPADVPSVAGMGALEEHFAAGVMGPITVLIVDPQMDFRGDRGRAVVGQLTDRLRRQESALALADVRSLMAPLGLTRSATHPFAGLHLPKKTQEEVLKEGAFQHYVTAMGGRHYIGTRLELVLAQNPFSQESIDNLERIEHAVRDALPDGMRQRAQLSFIGTTASVRDLAVVIRGDRLRIELLVVASVFVILLLLLRRLVLTLYLLLSVLFSYFATLGVTFAVFWLLDREGFSGLNWMVPLFLFTILIAVGEDYNIFLMTRIDEETRRFGPVRGITQALDRTGPVISSCGIIMAGTFASLLGGSLTQMKQLGFALAFGVLLDAFIVRPILVPAFLILWRGGRLRLKGWTWKPGRSPAGMAIGHAEQGDGGHGGARST
jgi:RND superfamily putative drug exporter